LPKSLKKDKYMTSLLWWDMEVVFSSPIFIVGQLATPGLVIWRFGFDFGHVIMYIPTSSFWEF
jgi:hypothetical protein